MDTKRKIAQAIVNTIMGFAFISGLIVISGLMETYL